MDIQPWYYRPLVFLEPPIKKLPKGERRPLIQIKKSNVSQICATLFWVALGCAIGAAVMKNYIYAKYLAL